MPRPSRLAALAAGLVAAGAACSKAAPPPAAPVPPAPVATAEAEPAVEAEPPAAAPPPARKAVSLFVAGPAGVREVGADGRELRVLTTTAGRFPRLTPDGSALLFVAGTEIRRVLLAGGADTVVAKLPEQVPACQAGTDVALLGLAVQGNAGFVLEREGGVACLELHGSGQEGAAAPTVAPARLRFDLANGTLLQAVALTAPCPEAAGVAPCQVAAAPDAAKASEPLGPYHLDRSRLSRREASGAVTVVTPVGTAQDFAEEAASPSGQWLVVGGRKTAGQRDLFLLDRKHGGIHPLVEGRWPAGVAHGDLAQIGRIRVPTHLASPASTVRWLSNQALIVDQLLVQPGQRIADLGGDVAP